VQAQTENALKLMQVVGMVSAFRVRHALTGPAFEELLLLLQACMPRCNILPWTTYRFKKVGRDILQQTMGGEGFQQMHLCKNKHCTHLYQDDRQRTCPLCEEPRYQQLENGEERAWHQLRYIGVEHGMRVLLTSKEVGRGLANFDCAAMVDTTYSVYSSRLSDALCDYFIPHYGGMDPDVARAAKIQFFESGQVLPQHEYEAYKVGVAEGVLRPTKLLLVEGGCDGFQPYQRRQCTTWLMGYRLMCVDWETGHRTDYEVVTALSEGESETKAAQVVCGLDAQQLLRLRPPSAAERIAGQLTGAVACDRAEASRILGLPRVGTTRP